MHLRLTVVSSDVQTPYCQTALYDSFGVTMQSYTCATASSSGLPIRYYYSVQSGVVGVLAALTTVTPSGATSIETVEVRTFATASPPNPTSISLVASKTPMVAGPSNTHTSAAHTSTPAIVGIVLGVLAAVLVLAFVVRFLWRSRNSGTYERDIRKAGLLQPAQPPF